MIGSLKSGSNAGVVLEKFKVRTWAKELTSSQKHLLVSRFLRPCTFALSAEREDRRIDIKRLAALD